MSDIIKEGNSDGINELIHMFREYDIVLNINVLFINNSINVIIHISIIDVLIIFVFIINYIRGVDFYV